MNTAEAARALLMPPTEIRRLIRTGRLPYSVRNGRPVVDERDLERLEDEFPDTYQRAPNAVVEFLDLLRTLPCPDLAAMLEVFRPVFEREDLDGLSYRVRRAG